MRVKGVFARIFEIRRMIVLHEKRSAHVDAPFASVYIQGLAVQQAVALQELAQGVVARLGDQRAAIE